MGVYDQLNRKWLKAAVLGCLWASSEIVLGSFLHNLRVPFTGSILTAIGIMLLISVSYLWKEKGLFWRAGLVCALMKTVSPSALIFGPMIAILSEAILMEISVRLLGKTWAGYIIGGILAMSWSLFQRIANLIIVYGLNMVELYSNLTRWAQNQLNIRSDNVWMPVFLLWLFYLVAGVLASVAGIIIGKRALRKPFVPEGLETKQIIDMQRGKKEHPFQWSVPWLFLNLSGMIATLFLMNKTNWKIWVPAGLILLVVWGFRYSRALKPLKKPRFWILFFLITMLTSFLFVKLRHTPDAWNQGLLTGLQMNFRAALMITGFSAIGTELYNPVIREFFRKTYLRQLPLALEVAFDTLPYVIARLPSFTDIFRKPVSIVHQLVSQADYFLEKVSLKFIDKPLVVILTGKIGDGKTQMLSEITAILQEKGIRVGGILASCIMENNSQKGYDLINVFSGEKVALSRISDRTDLVKVGRFSFFDSGLAFGRQALDPALHKGSKLVVVDEIGPWELEGEGWAGPVTELLMESQIPMIWTVRENLVAKVIENWNLQKVRVYNVSETTAGEVVGYLLENCCKN